MSRTPPRTPAYRFDRGELDLDRRVWVHPDGNATDLSPLEAELLQFLADRIGVTVPRSDLLEQVWDYAPGVKSRAVDNTVRRLRKKLDHDADESLIQSVYGGGYRLDAVPLQQPVRTVGTLPPVSDRGLVGRADDARRLSEALDTHQLVTVWGHGGVGKTSLARQALTTRGGTWVDLTEARTPAEMVTTVARNLGIPPAKELVQTADRVGVALDSRGGLVVFDNCEQLDEACLPELVRWLQGAPALTLLLTSRHPLELPGEQALELEPLPEDPALALLVRAARKVAPAFDATPEREAWLEVARLLDGLPLALLLCAPRVGTLPPDKLAERLRDSIKLVRKRPDGRTPERHLALARSLGWSWSLLEADSQEALAALCRIPGPFELDQAEAVIGTDDALDHIDDLQHTAWLQRTPTGRLTLFTSVRTFVGEQASEQVSDAAEDRRRRWLLDRAQDADHDWHLAQLTALERAAWRAVDRAPEEAAAVVERLFTVNEALATDRLLSLHEALLDRLDSDGQPHLALTLNQIHLAQNRTALTPELLHRGTEALDRANRLELPAEQIRARRILSQMVRLEGDLDRAASLLADASALADNHDLKLLQASCLNERGLLANHRGDLEAARSFHLESLSRYRAIGHPLGEIQALSNLGKVQRYMGQYDEAEATLADALKLAGDRFPFQRAITLTNVGNLRLTDARPAQAKEPLTLASQGFAKMGAARNGGQVCASLALCALMLGEHDDAEARALESIARLERAGDWMTRGRAWMYAATTAMIRGEHDLAAQRIDRGAHCFVEGKEPRAAYAIAQMRRVLAALRGQPAPSDELEDGDPAVLLAEGLRQPDPKRWLVDGDHVNTLEARSITMLVLYKALVE